MGLAPFSQNKPCALCDDRNKRRRRRRKRRSHANSSDGVRGSLRSQVNCTRGILRIEFQYPKNLKKGRRNEKSSNLEVSPASYVVNKLIYSMMRSHRIGSWTLQLHPVCLFYLPAKIDFAPMFALISTFFLQVLRQKCFIECVCVSKSTMKMFKIHYSQYTFIYIFFFLSLIVSLTSCTFRGQTKFIESHWQH